MVSDVIEIFALGVCYTPTTRFNIWITSQHPMMLVLKEPRLDIWIMNQHLVLHFDSDS